MGFLDYAWTISFQKDRMKLRILLDPCLDQPTINPDDFGFTINLPIPRLLDDNQVCYYGYKFAQDKDEKVKIGRLFRASVLHLTTHTLLPLPEKLLPPQTVESSIIENFARALVRDIHVNAYIQAWYPDRLVDFAYANALAFQKIKPTDRILTTSTQIMTALLSKVNMGIVKGPLLPEQEKAVNELTAKLSMLKETLMASLAGEQIKLEEVFDEHIRSITETLEPFGPFLEAPSLPYTEWIGPCSIFTDTQASDAETERVFKKSMEALGGTVFVEGSIDSCWRKEQEVESLQAFDSDRHQKMREEKILARLRQHASWTRFKSVSYPDEDYTQYLRARFLLQGGSRRLLDSLRIAQDSLDEDPGKEMGQLDLTAVIQALASKKPATDVFMKDEYLSKSFAWSIIFDASASMQVKGELARALAICVAEAAKELLMDPGSWTFFAFSDKFYVLKDSTEAYTRKVRARIGGLRFGGLTFMPDAIQLAGKILAQRFDEQRCLVVISDGWPYGYPNMQMALKESIDTLVRKGVLVFGVGVETERMGNFFKLNSAVYAQKDLIKKFANLFLQASGAALDA
jgi:Mg-chelatase subunit ChlD